MKKILILLVALAFYACQKPYAKLTKNDEKSEDIKTLFEIVGEENFLYAIRIKYITLRLWL